jgi:ATP-binding cassette subfamily B protein
MNEFDHTKPFEFSNLSFSYHGKRTDLILKNLNLTIKSGEQTAIVGQSGSGKSTLLKLMLGFYNPTSGSINIGNVNFNSINPNVWRDNIGVVLQDGFIFSDTIANNISMGKEGVDINQVIKAADIACIHDYVSEKLPMGYHTKIGAEGLSLSKGQQQRILIARAIVKEPKYIFMDEATSALDTSTERKLMDNLNEFFENRTVVVIAHRLSTVKNSDQILVLDDGKISESGNHKELVKNEGYYYRLIKDQLELGG